MIAKNSREISLADAEYASAPTAGVADRPVNAPIWSVLWRRRWVVVACLVVTMASAGAYLRKATPYYASNSRVYIQQYGVQILSDSAGGSPRNSSFLYTQAEVIKSSRLLESALERLSARSLKTFAGIDNPVGALQQATTVEVGKQNDIINVSFESPYPREAADVVNSIVGAYVAHQVEQQKNTAGEVLRVLRKEKADRERELQAGLLQIADFKQKNEALFFNTGGGNIALTKLGALSSSLTAAEMERLGLEAKYQAISKALANPSTNLDIYKIVQAQDAGLARDIEIDALRGELQKTLTLLGGAAQAQGERGPYLNTLQETAQRLRQQIAEKERVLVQAYLAQLELDRQATARRNEALQEAYDEQQEAAKELNTSSAELARLEANVQRIQSDSDLLDSRIKEVRVNNDDSALGFGVQVLEVARPSAQPARPQKARILGIALIGGLVLGAGLSLAWDFVDHRVRSADEVASVLGVPVLGVVPHMPGKQTVAVRGRQVFLNATSHISEAYRSIRTALYFGSSADTKMFLVTSASPGDGKSTTASNLAIAMAQAGHRTLLIDCDFRRPVQHTIYDLDTTVGGLTDVLLGRLPLRDALTRTQSEQLFLLPCGPVPSNPTEILTGKRFELTLQALSGAFDRVVIDSPPVSPVSDAQILASFVDAVVLVVRANKTTRRGCTHARETLEAVGANVCGVVVNDMLRHRGSYGYYYGYREPYRARCELETVPNDIADGIVNGHEFEARDSDRATASA